MKEQLRAHLLYLAEQGVQGLEIPGLPDNVSDNRAETDFNRECLQALWHRLENCTRCKLHRGRNNIVFGEGSPTPDIVFVGEGPGRDEDLQGRPFVGRAGALLNRILAAMGLQREEIYICNVVKCRPPNNRNPEPDEISTCSPFLAQQIDILQPRVICALGNVAAAFLTGRNAPMTVLRGRFYDYRGICVRPTYHPAAILRNPGYRRPVWEDVQELMRYIGKPVP
ncbi:uracil-DNA glycosylase [bacterium]|nr:uracil-DNA glycosylase [candidate division CSSED10-310 bacterium]